MSYSQLYKGPMLYKGPWEHCILLPKVKYYLEKLHLQVQEQEQVQGLVHDVLVALTVEEQQIVVGD